MKDPHTIIHSQIISEKGTELAEKNNQYLFRVATTANKIEVGKAIEAIFKVKVISTNILNRVGKNKRRGAIPGKTSDSRRAIVRLADGNSISLT